MSYTNFRTVPATGSPKVDNDATPKDLRVRQMEELIRQSEDARKEVYGANHEQTTANFYNLFESTKRMPSYRPKISAPQLQILLLKEAVETTDPNIRINIHKNGDQDKEREKGFQEHWRKNFFGLQLLMAQVYAQFSGTSFVQAGNDPLARQGKGNVWMRARKQDRIYVDPVSPWSEDWSWLIIEDKVYMDRVKKETPDHTEEIRKEVARTVNLAGSPAGSLEMPPGPMSITARGLPYGGEETTTEGLLTRRTGYFIDVTQRAVTEAEKRKLEEKKLPVPVSLPAYPQGRMIVELEGTVLVDGHSWVPLPDIWPLVPVWALPPWDNVWCPAPMKYTKSLQDAAEQQMTNTYENARRLNNGMMIIHESTGLTANSVGGMPGEIQVVAANSQPGTGVQILYPPPFPPQMIQYPQTLLALQKELRGATDARSGNMAPGNVGPDLFEAAVAQSSSGTRLTTRFFAYSVQKVCELLFYTMGMSYTDERTFLRGKKVARWTPIQGDDDYEVDVPVEGIRPLSEGALRNLVIELKKAGMIDTRHGLEMLDIPDADEIADANEQELKLMALAKGIKK
jgi:hypothetical protein